MIVARSRPAPGSWFEGKSAEIPGCALCPLAPRALAIQSGVALRPHGKNYSMLTYWARGSHYRRQRSVVARGCRVAYFAVEVRSGLEVENC